MAAESDAMIRAMERKEFALSEPELEADVDILKMAMAILERELSKKPDAWLEKSSGYASCVIAQALAVITEASDGFSEADKNRLTAIVARQDRSRNDDNESPTTPTNSRGAMRRAVRGMMDKAFSSLEHARAAGKRAEWRFGVVDRMGDATASDAAWGKVFEGQ